MKKEKNTLSFDQIIDRICTAVNIVTGDDGHRAKQTLETFLQLGCDMVEGATYKDKNSKVTFKGTEFGDDSQTEFGGDEPKKDEEKN